MKIHIPAFEAMAKGNEHMNHGPLDIDLGPDVVEVARCKDCQYYQDAKINKKGFLICPASGMEITETDYCSYGVRMGQEDKHEVKCAKCGEIKEIICTVDGKPWCEDCLDRAMGWPLHLTKSSEVQNERNPFQS